MLTTQDLRGDVTLEKPTPLLLEVLGKRKGGCPSVPRTPTSPMELVGNRSPSAGAQLHPGHEEGRSDERERRERETERESKKRGEGERKEGAKDRDGGRRGERESLSNRDRERQRPREATGNWKRERQKGRER